MKFYIKLATISKILIKLRCCNVNVILVCKLCRNINVLDRSCMWTHQNNAIWLKIRGFGLRRVARRLLVSRQSEETWRNTSENGGNARDVLSYWLYKHKVNRADIASIVDYLLRTMYKLIIEQTSSLVGVDDNNKRETHNSTRIVQPVRSSSNICYTMETVCNWIPHYQAHFKHHNHCCASRQACMERFENGDCIATQRSNERER